MGNTVIINMRLRSGNGEDSLITAQNLTKLYKGPVLALDDFTVRIPEGRIGLLGPNGAGKSTFMKILVGLIRPSSGSGEVLGRDVVEESTEIKKYLGFMPEYECLPAEYTAIDFVADMGRMCGYSYATAMQRAHEVLQYLGMGDERYRLIKTYSHGMRQKVKLAQSIIHDPKIMLFDEPTAGLDPFARDEMLRTISEIAAKNNSSFILSTHILHDVERICDRVVLINKGRLVIIDKISRLMEQHGRYIKVIVTKRKDELQRELKKEGLGVTIEGDELLVRREGDCYPSDIIFSVAARLGVSVRSITDKATDLDQIYLKLMRDEKAKFDLIDSLGEPSRQGEETAGEGFS